MSGDPTRISAFFLPGKGGLRPAFPEAARTLHRSLLSPSRCGSVGIPIFKNFILPVVSHAIQPQPTAPVSDGAVAPDKLTLAVLHRVLQRLLNVDVPTPDLVLMLEAIAEVAEQRDGLANTTTREVA